MFDVQLEIIYGRHLPTAIKTAFKIIKNLVEKMRKVTLWLKFRRWTKHWDFDYIWFEKKVMDVGFEPTAVVRRSNFL